MPPAAGPHRIVLFSANPSETGELALDEEARLIRIAIGSSPPPALELISIPAVRPRDVGQALRRQRPRIVQFSGHGTEHGELLLKNDAGEKQRVKGQALAELLGQFKTEVRVVLFNVCHSLEIAKAVATQIACAIGMPVRIDSGLASYFASSFYGALASGESVKDAFIDGVMAIQLEVPKHELPVLQHRSDVDPSQEYLARPVGGWSSQEVKRPEIPAAAARSVSALKRADLEEEIARLSEKQVVAGHRLEQADAAARQGLRRELDVIKNRIETLYAELDRHETDADRLHDKFVQIDFKRVQNAVNAVFDFPTIEPCAAGFVLQKGLKLGGEYCAKRVRQLLDGRRRHLVPWRAEFTVTGGRYDERRVLDDLGRHLNLAGDGQDLDAFAGQIVDRMCGALQPASVAFLELAGWDYLTPTERVFGWFLECFWRKLTAALAARADELAGVRFIALLTIDQEIPGTCLTGEHFSDHFQSGKLMKIPLQKWKQREIEEWLIHHSARPQKTAIVELAKRIHDATDGVPLLVWERIRRELLS